MSAKLKLQPFSATASQTKDISFVLSGLDASKKYRVLFENATLQRAAKIVSSDKGTALGDRLILSNTDSVSGKIDLSIYEIDSISVASIYANIEEQTESEAWRLSDIAAFSFQIENSVKQTTGDKVSVYPPFVGLEQKATIKVQTDPNSSLHVIVNNKRFVIKSNFAGEGTFSFRAIDVLGSSSSSKSLQKFQVTYAKPKDNYKEIYDSGVFVHFVPESMKALQATNDPEAPECAILDPVPGEGLTVEKLDDYCIDGPVVGPLSIFDADNEDSDFYNSKVGFCTQPRQIYPTASNDAICRIYNSTDSTVLSNGSGLAVFSSQQTFASEPNVVPNLASRVFVASIPSSLKFKGNPIRDGTIIKPPSFYHTATPSNISINDKYSLLFRIDDSTLFEIQYTSLQGTVTEIVSSFVELINNDTSARAYGIKAVDQSTFIEIKSETRFSIRSSVIDGNGTLEVELKSNKTLDLLTDLKGVSDSGDTIIFLFPKVGYQSHKIVSRDVDNKIIRFEVPSGFNNDIGPTIIDNYYCEKYVVVDGTTELPSADLVEVNPLPYIYDIYNREVPCVYPVIATKKTDSGDEIAYVVCQAPVNGIYQLFFFSFRVGESVENVKWKQLTQTGENKNAKIKCDSAGNLHFVWESDRMGPTQIYYSVLGSSSRTISNAVLMSIIDKNISQDNEANLLVVSSPITSIQDQWTRILQGNGRASIYDVKYVAVEGSPSEDTAMAFFSITKDELGNDISWNFGQLSYQISFEFWMPLLPDGILEEDDIEDKFAEWKADFTPVGDYKYEKDGNFYTIDSYEPFYDNIIPVCGSYKLNPDDMSIVSGGLEVSDIPHRQSATYADFSEEIRLSQPSNIRHFMLAMIPEKIRFKAKNFESLTQYCERLGVSREECEGFNNEIVYELDTGKYKLALLVSTSENVSSGEISRKNYKITRFLSGFIDFTTPRKIKIAVHYSKNGSDEIEKVLTREIRTSENNYRFNGDIIVTVDDSPVFATSFLADFSDQYRRFDIGLGFPPGQGISIDESIPYKGNMFESGTMKQVFADISIGAHSISLNPDYFDISEFDRDTSEMVIIEKTTNILENGGFESTVLPYSDETEMFDGYQGVTDWTVGYSTIYKRRIGTDNVISSWMELNGIEVGGTLFKGFVTTTISTIIGKKYYVFFDIGNSVNSYLQGFSITKRLKVTAGPVISTYSTNLRSTELFPSPNWKTKTLSFTAVSTSTMLKFENASTQFGTIKDVEQGPQLDKIIVISEDDLNDELNSFITAESLMIDQNEFDLNYSLNVVESFTQLPVTVSLDFQNKNADMTLDKIDKLHLAWQSNRNGFWDIYYSGFRVRGEPFRNDIRISSSKAGSINPSIAVDSKGRRLIVWQDNRTEQNQIYAALSKAVDDKLLDRCKQDEVDEFLYQWNSTLDPLVDPYAGPISQLNCAIEFSFTAPTSDLYHFNLLVYEDKDHEVPYKTITSKTSIDGWKVNDEQISYGGLEAEESTAYTISYLPSYSDDLSGKIFYVVVEFEVNSIPIDFRNSLNLKMLQPYNGLNLGISRIEDANYRAMLEFDDLSPVGFVSQTASDINTGSGLFTGMTFESPLTELPGFSKGDKIKSILLHFDPIGTAGSVTSVIKFTSPIIAIFTSATNVIAGNTYFGYPGISYPDFSVIGLESFDTINISADRKTLTITSFVSPSMDEVRVVLADNATVVDQNEFVYYCPTKQSERCDVKCLFVNNTSIDKTLHFRVTFYADIEKTHVITSSFTRDDTLNWIVGPSTFPEAGLVAKPGQTINAIYTPEIIPFELFESQVSHTFSSSIIRQPLLCGTTYHVVVESYRDGIFFVESEFDFICPCSETKSDIWDRETDSLTWICSGQGFEDFRISITDNQCLFPKIGVTDFDLFYILWQDFRYARIQSNQLPLSPDCFMGIYDAAKDEFICSGQGNYDRRITNFNTNGLILYDASIFIDPFQNLNVVMHDGEKVYVQSCTLGCKLTSLNKDLTLPCMFTDETDSTFFVLGGSPDRTVDQYQKIRISDKYVAFSTYLDLHKPIPIVNDCFLEFNIIGVPGTYAYRLKNENDEEWSEWLPIGADLPVQTQTDSSTTEKERDFFRAYFTQKDVFTAPWVSSPGNGLKRVCCEILTFFGKTSTFCVDFMAIYDNLEYKIDLFFDSEFTQPVPKFNNYMVVSEHKTETLINDTNLTSIKETTEQVSIIYARIEFKDKGKIKLIEKLQSVERFNYLDQITMSVYQQGINDQLSLALEKISNGVYRGSFEVEADDGVVNVDGLAIIVVDVPGQCKSVSFTELSQRAERLETTRTLDQEVSIFNDFTIFRDQYTGDDIKGSFGNPNYYKIKKFGSSSISNNAPTWIGAGAGPINKFTSSGSIGSGSGSDGSENGSSGSGGSGNSSSGSDGGSSSSTG